MADDSISYDVIVDFITNNAASSLKDVERYQSALDELAKSNKVSENQFIASSAALGRMGNQFETGLGSVKNYTKGFLGLTQELQAAQKQFARLSQTAVARGSIQPFDVKSTQISLKDAQKYIAIQEAASASVLDQARRVVAAEKAKQSAAKATADTIVASEKRSEAALQKTLKSEYDLARAKANAATRSNMSQWDAEFKALNDVANASRKAAENLPRLRYALYDVSSTLTMAGAGMIALAGATVGASVAMDRQFADVIRTTELYTEDLKDSAVELRKEFNELFATMPSSWGDLTEIGTLAGQLNIAGDNVAEFTRLVAQFAATTDVSIEDSATAFGRLSQLLDVPAAEFQNLGSSILAVGVNSVATESQIINISTQITSMAASAGFTADQVFGLSSALASLGTQPELSRGVITRLFSNINAAIQSGSERLEQFGAQIGKTGKEFSEAWSSDASGTLLALMEGIGSKEGPAAVATLNELGIVASRDVPTLLRLAQNSDVLRDSLATAAQGYADGTALSEQYGVVALTVAERLKVLWNNVQLLFTAFGDTQSILGPVIDRITEIVQLFTKIASNPVGQFFSLLAVGVIAAAGAVTLLAGAATRGVAGVIAIRTALGEMGLSASTGRLKISELVAALFGLDVAGKKASATVAATSMSLLGLTKGAGLAANAVTLLGNAWKVAWPFAAISAGLYVVTKAVSAIGDAMRSNQQVAEDYFGSFTGLEDALAADNAADYAGKKYGEVSRVLEETKESTDNARAATAEWLGIQKQVPEGADAATGSIESQTLVLGENTEAWLKNQLAANEAFQDFATNANARQAMTDLGFDMQEFIAAGLEGGDAFDRVVEDMKAKAAEAIREGRTEVFGGLFASMTDSAEGAAELYDILDNLEDVFPGLHDEISTTQEVAELLGTTADDTSDSMASLGSSASDALSDFLDIQNGILGVQNSLFGLGEALSENGANFDIFAASGRDNTEALLSAIQAITAESGSNVAQAAANLQALFDYITLGGYASAEQLGVLTDAIETLKAAAGTSVLPEQNLQINSFFGGWASGAEKAQKATRKAKEEIVTISDYAKDLASIWDRAFDIRFSGEETMDRVTSSFQKLRDEATASAERVANIRNDITGLREDITGLQDDINGLNSDIKGLQADKALQEYFLGVANQYGDTNRATQIRDSIRELDDEIASKQGDVADKQKDIADAQTEIKNKSAEAQAEIDAQTKSLQGNSAEAVKNREAIRGLVQEYQAHIQALADSGVQGDELRAKTQELKNDFYNQATQLGFNREELSRYAAAFDDVTLAIDRVPNNVTVEANVDPALQALAEFEERARVAAANAAESIATGAGSGYYVPEITLPVRANIEEITYENRPLAGHMDVLSQPRGSGSRSRPAGAGQSFSGGGYTGPGGKYEPAGIVHRGEYVVRKEFVNQRTGLPYADALGHISRGQSGRTGYAGGGYVGGGAMFTGQLTVGSFGPMAQQQLMASQQTVVALSGRTIADSSAREFSNSTATGAA